MNGVAFSPDSGPTIRDLELDIEQVLDRVRLTSGSTTQKECLDILTQLREVLAPFNFRPVVQLEEDGRKKRSTAGAENWKFKTGEIKIYYEPASNSEILPEVTTPKISLGGTVIPIPTASSAINEEETAASKIAVQQCCEALAEAEKPGKQFIALKWFRDLALAALPYQWAKSADSRQRVLSEAIDAGAILVKKIPNPKSPMHPTTTVSLNRGSSAVSIPSRFNPVPIKGEPASATLLRDRGNY
jgi:hypothetical protein